jgi:hypothetical protein
MLTEEKTKELEAVTNLLVALREDPEFMLQVSYVLMSDGEETEVKRLLNIFYENYEGNRGYEQKRDIH